MKQGDRVIITTCPQNAPFPFKGVYFFKVGDKATLHHQDEDGDWWADFKDGEYCIQAGISTSELIGEENAS